MWFINAIFLSSLLAQAAQSTGGAEGGSQTVKNSIPSYGPGSTSIGAVSTFSFPPDPSQRVATSNKPLSIETYAKSYQEVSSLFANVSSTTWSNWTPSVVVPTPASNPYGAAAYSALWSAAAPANFSRGLFSTTVSPTPVPTSELIYPPPLVFSPSTKYTFPDSFVFGVAGSASQCEGAVADHGKSPAITDMLGNLLDLLKMGGTNNYVTNEHYYLYKQDIERFAAIGVKYYSFTIPWTRILPFAVPGSPVNSEALQHYSDVIDYVLSKGMKPVVTLTHFDTPLQFYGGGSQYILNVASTRQYYGIGEGLHLGYTNATFQDAFVSYAKIVMSHYADRVPMWVTFNEPQIGADNGLGVDAVVRAHARVVHYYREVLNGSGRVSMKMGLTPAVPQDPSQATHVEAALQFTDLYVNPFLNPLILGKDYPAAYKAAIQDYVPLSSEDLEYMKGTLDYISIDGYSAPTIAPLVTNFTACANNNATTNPFYRFPICLNYTAINPAGWSFGYSPAGSPSDYIEPRHLRTQLKYLWQTFKSPIVVSEFGLELPVPPGGRLQDNLYNAPQSVYILSYLQEMLKAIWEDGVDVLGAFVWNWGDDWEFINFDTGFGLQFVNRTTQERAYRRSFFDVIDFIESRRRSS